MISHVGTSSLWGLLFESSDLHGSILNREVGEEGLWSSLMLMLDWLGGGVRLSLSLLLTTIKGHMNGDLSFIFDTGISKEHLVTESLDSELEVEFFLNVHVHGDLIPRIKIMSELIKIDRIIVGDMLDKVSNNYQ